MILDSWLLVIQSRSHSDREKQLGACVIPPHPRDTHPPPEVFKEFHIFKSPEPCFWHKRYLFARIFGVFIENKFQNILDKSKASEFQTYFGSRIGPEQVSKLIFKCINNIASINFQNCFKINHEIEGYITRPTPVLIFCKYYKLLSEIIKRIWNTLHTNIKNITSLHVFLKKLKLKYIIFQYMVDIINFHIYVSIPPIPSSSCLVI